MKVRLGLLIGIMLLTAGCSNSQITKWLEWHNQDPVAAEEFANRPEIQEWFIVDWDHDGIIEPENPVRRRENNSQSNNNTSSQQERNQQESSQSTNTSGGDVWDRVAQCESGGNWSINTGNGYSGGLQFLHSSWRAYGGQEFAPLAYQASREQQIIVAERILDDNGWRAWPACSRKLGLR